MFFFTKKQRLSSLPHILDGDMGHKVLDFGGKKSHQRIVNHNLKKTTIRDLDSTTLCGAPVGLS
jgi:hypothetical protein